MSDGARGAVDLASRIVGRGGVFGPLENPQFFRQVRVNDELGTLVWPNKRGYLPPPPLLLGDRADRLAARAGNHLVVIGPTPRPHHGSRDHHPAPPNSPRAGHLSTVPVAETRPGDRPGNNRGLLADAPFLAVALVRKNVCGAGARRGAEIFALVLYPAWIIHRRGLQLPQWPSVGRLAKEGGLAVLLAILTLIWVALLTLILRAFFPGFAEGASPWQGVAQVGVCRD